MVITYFLAKLVTAFLRNLRDARLEVNDGGCDSDRTVPLIARSRQEATSIKTYGPRRD